MNIQIMHDSTGKIYAIFAPIEGKRQGRIESTDPNMKIVETEAPENLLSLRTDQNEDIAAALESLMRDFMVDSGCLVERSRKSSTD
jgi:hypothetical protein